MIPGAAGTPGALAVWERLSAPESAPLLEALRGTADSPAPALIERLRRGFDAETVNAAIRLCAARTRAREKFGERAETLWCLRAGVEMASSPAIARWKAARFRAAGAERIDDLCCGIGGDLAELAGVAEAVGADLDPVHAWMAARNAGARTRVADVVTEPGDAPFAHADPARRTDGARIHRAEDLQPSLGALQGAMRGRAGAAIKLGPGMDLGPGDIDAADEVEFVGEHGRLAQQVVWSGALARTPGARTATRACTGASITGMPGDAPAAEARMGRALFVPDPALERARLLPAFAARMGAVDAAPGLGILTRDERAPLDAECAGWFESWEVMEELPAREQAVAAWLAARGAGIVTVRTRGGACDPDAWQRSLRGAGDVAWTVFVLRLGGRRAAYPVRRIAGA
jgi:THUMP domain-like